MEIRVMGMTGTAHFLKFLIFKVTLWLKAPTMIHWNARDNLKNDCACTMCVITLKTLCLQAL